MDKYEYLTGEGLGYKPGVVQKVKSKYSPLGEALNNKVRSKTGKRNKVVNRDKQNKNLIYNSQLSFVKSQNISSLKELSPDFMHKKLNHLHKTFTGFKNVSPQKKNTEDLKAKGLEYVRDLFNELYYIYKERFEEKKML